MLVQVPAFGTEGDKQLLVISGGWLFDGVSNARRHNSGIVIKNGKILEVDVDVQQQIPVGATIIKLSKDETILPGLMDLHAHYNMDLVDKGRVEEVAHNGVIFNE